ncbi:MAG TPA: serine/threonine protein kinase [Microscillaceae bacterium]|nr:serine/threonine protein kinase [Microscillaceae bacterium]
MNQLRTRVFIIKWVLLLAVMSPLEAQDIFVIKSQKTRQSLFPAFNAEYFEDKTGKLSFEQVQQQHFIPNRASSLNFGYSSSTFWIRLQLQNASAANDWRFLSFIPYHNYLDYWQQTSPNTWKHIQTGWMYPFASRGNFEHVGFAFPLDLPQGSITTIYFKLSGYDPLTFPLELIQKQSLDLRFQLENLYYGIYFGILAVMLLYNLFIYVTLRDRNYLYYVAYILCLLIIFSSSTGYLFRYIHPDLPLINLYSSRITMGVIVIMTSLFAIHFLELKKYILWFYKLFLIDIGLAVLAIIVTGTELYSSATNDLLSIHSPLLLLAGILAWRRGNQSARYYVLAWSIFIIGATTITLRNMGLLPINAFTTHTVEIGSALEIILLSLALADKYRILRIEKEKATYEALIIQQKANEELEGKVKERTLELSESNTELRQINEELDATLHTVRLQKNEIEEQNIQINDSIHYAQRIQQAILPLEHRMKEILPPHFLLYRPRDIVSGDFYWAEKLGDKAFLIVGDCTGHGVPGAFMTMLGIQAINQIVLQKGVEAPHQILNLLDEMLPSLLKSENTSVNDGMDIAVVVLDTQQQTLSFAGAKSPLLMIQEGHLVEIKGNNFAINGFRSKSSLDESYTLHSFPLSTNTQFFLSTDGFQDQFGGDRGRKFMKRRFKNLLSTLAPHSVETQQLMLENELDSWMDGYRQLDDILVLGIKASLL